MYIKTITVSALNTYIKKLMDADFILGNLSVKGEISNLKMHSNGHIYFSLKDDDSKINCVMFKNYAVNLSFLPQNGMKVLAKGRVSTYVKDGSYELYCENMEIEGIGELYVAFENLKRKLLSEGLFEEAHKKNIPPFAKKIGVITSPTGAAIKDIINVVKRRNKSVEVLIFPSLVQGTQAAQNIIEGIKCFDRRKDIDLIIIARGGGSLEELWSFNDESLAREIYSCNKCIITGIGHETDFTIADFVSDRRAPTPSAAAEIAVQSNKNLLINLINLKSTLDKCIIQTIGENKIKFEMNYKLLNSNSPNKIIANEIKYIDLMNIRLKKAMDLKIKDIRGEMDHTSSVLRANNYENILSKGYAILNDEDGNIISSVNNLNGNKKLNITLKDGRANGVFTRIL